MRLNQQLHYKFPLDNLYSSYLRQLDDTDHWNNLYMLVLCFWKLACKSRHHKLCNLLDEPMHSFFLDCKEDRMVNLWHLGDIHEGNQYKCFYLERFGKYLLHMVNIQFHLHLEVYMYRLHKFHI